jgi:hypothetical protein
MAKNSAVYSPRGRRDRGAEWGDQIVRAWGSVVGAACVERPTIRLAGVLLLAVAGFKNIGLGLLRFHRIALASCIEMPSAKATVSGQEDNCFMMMVARRAPSPSDQPLLAEHFREDENEDGASEPSSEKKIEKGISGCGNNRGGDERKHIDCANKGNPRRSSGFRGKSQVRLYSPNRWIVIDFQLRRGRIHFGESVLPPCGRRRRRRKRSIPRPFFHAARLWS